MAEARQDVVTLRAALKLVRSRVLCQMRAPCWPITSWLANSFWCFWLHRAVTLSRPNAIVNCGVNQSELSELLQIFHSNQLRAAKNCGTGCYSTTIALPLMRHWYARNGSMCSSNLEMTDVRETDLVLGQVFVTFLVSRCSLLSMRPTACSVNVSAGRWHNLT